MNEHPKIHDHHRQRLATVYIRQSTLRQVAEHLESQDLQYQLVARAQAWGWPAERIAVIDEDLGKSAVSSQERYGFQRLFTDVGTGKVGLLLVTDVSRLARNCADWYQLLDLAARNHVLVSDSGGVYDPRAYDDRLLLGVKGAFSEAQWHLMRAQMQAARLNKAKRGELALRLPIGYQRLPNGQVILTADEQVQTSIRQVFHLFRRLGSAHAVLGHLQQTGLRLPARAAIWSGRPSSSGTEPVTARFTRYSNCPPMPASMPMASGGGKGCPARRTHAMAGGCPRPNGKSCSGMPFPAILPGRNIWKTRRNWRKTGRPPPLPTRPTPRSMAVRGHNPSPPKARPPKGRPARGGRC